MNHILRRISRSILGVLLVVVLCSAAPASAAVTNWQKGVSIVPRWNTDFGSDSFKQSVRDAKATNSNYVTLIIPLGQSNAYSTDVGGAWNTPTDESLASGIDFVHSLGMKVNLKIHLESHDGQWRANINPGDRNAWFTAYGNMVKKYARIAATKGVAEMTIGAELINMAAHDANWSNTENWNKLIRDIRAIYTGKLTYSANWGSAGWTDEKNRIQFWNSLDAIGVSAYFPLATGDSSVEAYKREWDKVNNGDIKPLQQKFQKPILFTEVGYRSHDWSQWEPFNYWSGGNHDQGNQARLYDALYSYWNGQSFMQGVHWWDWSSDPNAGGQWNNDYTPQNKEAEAVMTRWNAGGTTPEPNPTPTPTTTPTPTPSPSSFDATVTASANPASPVVNQKVTITGTVKNNGGAANGIVVDMEVYSGSNKLHQQFYENQSFAAGETKTFTTSWTPTAAGTYTVKMGLFSNDWSKNYKWVDAMTITVTNQTNPNPTPTPTTTPSPSSFDATVSATANPSAPNVNQQTTIGAKVKNNGSAAGGILVDVEVYNGSNKVHQKYYESQSFTSGETKSYNVNWTPTAAGTYTVKMGLFSNDWSKNYKWEDTVTTIAVGQTQTTSTPTPTTTPNPSPQPSNDIQIWWPSNGGWISGVQPFQAMIEGRSIFDYHMYWQVDGGTLNELGNSSRDYPHKESLVDVNPWTWRQNGPYEITFIAKDKQGNLIGQKKITVYVSHW